jgi:hypothetical protein
MPIMELFFYGFTLWLGAYLLARDSRKATVFLTGWGLIAYAFGLDIQINFTPSILFTARIVMERRDALLCLKKTKHARFSLASMKSLAWCYNHYRNLPFFFQLKRVRNHLNQLDLSVRE